MARSKNVGAKRIVKKHVASKTKTQKPNLTTDESKQIREVQKKYEQPIKRPKAEKEKIKKELNDLRRPLYSLRSKLKKTSSKTEADRLRKEIKKYEKATTSKIDSLVERRNDVKYIEKKFESIRKEKVRGRSKIKSIERAIDKAEENKDWKEVERLSAHKVNELRKIDELNEMLGMPILKLDIEKEETDDIRGFSQDAANPLTIWEAMQVFKDDRASGEWDVFIIDGERIKASNVGLLVMAASSFWITVQGGRTKTPLVDRFYNNEKRIVKYEPHKS